MIVDAHAHFAGDVPEAVELLEELGLQVLNVCVAYDRAGRWREQAEGYRRLAAEHPRSYAWCTSFDPPGPDDGPGYADRIIRGLERDFANGAVACKVWRNVGMELRNRTGGLIMVDDPLLQPVFSYLECVGQTALMHIGEPQAAWQPLDGNPYRDVYVREPELHLYGRAGLPPYGELIASRDRVLARHPDLRVVGAHLGSLEHDVAEIASRMDRHPNFAVDTSARLFSLALQPRQAVRQFLIAYQDRVLFGSDVVAEQPLSTLAPAEREQARRLLREAFESARAFFGSGNEVMIRGRKTQGLELPAEVLDRLFSANARRWYPALNAERSAAPGPKALDPV